MGTMLRCHVGAVGGPLGFEGAGTSRGKEDLALTPASTLPLPQA